MTTRARSEQKWAEKREDAKAPKAPPLGPTGHVPHVPNAKQKEVSEKAAADLERRVIAGRIASARGLGDEARRLGRDAAYFFKPGTTESKQAHKEAGEAHLATARAFDRLGKSMGGAMGHAYQSEAGEHREAAASHAISAGIEWDESKHPRDEAGKFS